jgi:TPR repeat protein
MAVPDAASSLDETARPAQAFDSENLASIPESGANRVKSPENANLRSRSASHWGIVSVIGGVTLAASVAFFLMTKDSGHNNSAPPSGTELPAAPSGNVSSTVAPAVPAPVPAPQETAAQPSAPATQPEAPAPNPPQTTTSTVQRAPVTDCDRLAAGADDPDRIEGVKGVPFDQINIDLALPACVSATKSYQAERRLVYQLGRVLEAAKRFDEERKVLVDADNAGSTQAMVLLGEMYADGEDDAEAVRLYRKAADLGNALAMNNLGNMYARGQGVAMDEAEAVRLYRQAADLGNSTAMYNLGLFYENGYGVTKDIAKARSYYQMAADGGDNDAKDALKRLSATRKKK